MLKWLAVACGAEPLVAACASQMHAGRSAPNVARRLAPVHVLPTRVIREVVGLRPFRPSGFVVRAERFGDKLLVHNYGHGGGGVSLSWGTANLAADLARQSDARQAAVLGCGAVGLATARLLQDRGYGVTIYARELPPNTTSNIAGAQWLPVTVADAPRRTPAFDAQFLAASRFAFRYYQTLVGRSTASRGATITRCRPTARRDRAWRSPCSPISCIPRSLLQGIIHSATTPCSAS